MSRISRKTLNIFAGSAGAVAGGIGEFGSAQAGSPTFSTDPAVIQSLAAWLGGWANAVIGGSKFPCLEDMNAVQYVLSYMGAYLFQEGIPEYDSGTTYYTNSIVKNPSSTQLFKSLTNANQGNALPIPPASNSNWQYLGDLSGLASVYRTSLTANKTYYISPSGNDTTGDGSSGNPWATPQKAVNVIADTIDLNGFTATISCANTGGSPYSGVSVNQPFTGGGTVALVGNISTPDNCVFSNSAGSCIVVSGGAELIVSGGFKLQTSGSVNYHGISAFQGGKVVVNGAMDYGAISGSQIEAHDPGSQITVNANYSITGSAIYHINASGQSQINTPGSITATLTGTPAFSQEFASATSLANVAWANVTFSGAATGTRYQAALNGVMNTGGGGANYFPGNAAGSTSAGGQYA